MQIKTCLHLQAAVENGITYLKKSYCTTPLKVININEDKQVHTLQLMLMSSSPGILDGDEYDLNIDLEVNSSLQLHTQSYQRLFTMQQNARQKMEIRLAENAAFYFTPHPVVPHENANFTARNKIYLSDNCSLIFGEIITCGRKAAIIFKQSNNCSALCPSIRTINPLTGAALTPTLISF